MTRKLSLTSDGVVGPKANRPMLPKLQVSPSTQHGKRLVRLHKLISGEAPNICIRRGPGIGDLLMATPSIRFVSGQYPDSTITVATDMGYLDGALPAVLKHNPYVQHVVDWDNFSGDDYDVVLDIHCPCIAHEQPLARPVNRIDLFARHLGIATLDDVRPFYTVHPDEADKAMMWLSRNVNLRPGDSLLVINPFASNKNRSMSPVVMRDALRMIRQQGDSKIKTVVVTHTSDYTEEVSWEAHAHAVARNWSIRDVAALLKYADLLICPDSALLHMAGALDISALALFGPTDARARVNHYPKSVGLWPGQSLHCSPCWYESGRCRHQTCWKMIQVTDISSAALSMLGRNDTVAKGELQRQAADSFKRSQKRGTIKTEVL